jgi:predicted RNA-binding Zn-ribbon protein involved in translation (DUF1610 family)
MWTCIRCGTALSVEDAPPNVDDFGVHFMCPVCGRRNRLKNIGREGIEDDIVLMQIDDPDPK